MSHDSTRFLQMIGKMSGETITPQMAMLARDLSGFPMTPAEQAPIELMKGQLLILFLRDLGGEKTYSVREVDDDTREYLLCMEQKPGPSFRFYLRKKPNQRS